MSTDDERREVAAELRELAEYYEKVAIDPVVIPNYCPNCGARVVHDA